MSEQANSISELSVKSLSQPDMFNQKLLLIAMNTRNPQLTTSYNVEDGVRQYDPIEDLTDMGIEKAVRQFKENPFACSSIGFSNLLAILDDPHPSLVGTDGKIRGTKEQRLGRYFDAYVDLVIKLDHAAFPGANRTANPEPEFGFPSYIPDGYSDLGFDPRTDPKLRVSEKISIPKAEVYEKEKRFLLSLCKKLENGGFGVEEDRETFLASEILNHVYAQTKYDEEITHVGKSVPLHRYREEGVCRHMAQEVQLLGQITGIETRIVWGMMGRPEVKKGGHAGNFMRVNGKWNYVDITRPASTKPLVFLDESRVVNDDVVDLEEGKEFAVGKEIMKQRPVFYRILKND